MKKDYSEFYYDVSFAVALLGNAEPEKLANRIKELLAEFKEKYKYEDNKEVL